MYYKYTCSDGTPDSGDATADGIQRCASCNSGFNLLVNNTCCRAISNDKDNDCVADSVDACPSNRALRRTIRTNVALDLSTDTRNTICSDSSGDSYVVRGLSSRRAYYVTLSTHSGAAPAISFFDSSGDQLPSTRCSSGNSNCVPAARDGRTVVLPLSDGAVTMRLTSDSSSDYTAQIRQEPRPRIPWRRNFTPQPNGAGSEMQHWLGGPRSSQSSRTMDVGWVRLRTMDCHVQRGLIVSFTNKSQEGRSARTGGGLPSNGVVNIILRNGLVGANGAPDCTICVFSRGGSCLDSSSDS